MNQILTPETKVYVETQTILLDSYHSGEIYGDWSANYLYQVLGVKLTQEDYEDCFDLGESIFVGDIVHVVSISYSDGDSFGQANGKGELVWVFKDEVLAVKAKNEIEKNKDEYSIKIDLGENRSMKWSNPAAGYFENLENVNIDSFEVKP